MALPLAVAVLFVALLVEHRLLARAHPGYFRRGMLCYSAVLYPEDTSDPDGSLEDMASEARAKLAPVTRLLESRGAVPSRRDPHYWWTVRRLDATSFALVPRVNPLLLRATITVDEGVQLDGFVPYSAIPAAGMLLFLPSWWVAGGLLVVGLAVIVGFYLALDRLIYGTIEPEVPSADDGGRYG